MKQNSDQFTPIKLPKVQSMPRISNQGYYNVKIKNAWEKHYKGERTLFVLFEVISGKAKGVRIRRQFYLTETGVVPLSYMCSYIGIKEELKDLKLLLGKKLTVHVAMEKSSKTSIPYPEIKLFLPFGAQTSSEKKEESAKI